MQFSHRLSLLRELPLVSCITWPTENINKSSAARWTTAASRSSEKAVAHVKDREIRKGISKTW